VLIVILCLWLIQGQQSPAKGEAPANAQQQTSPSVSSRAPGRESRQAGNSGEQNQNNTAKLSDPLIVLQFLLFVAVLAQAAIYVWQAILMRRTLGDTIKAQRAYITAKTALDVRHGQLTLVIENSGNTPANDVRVTCYSGRRPNSPDSEPKYTEVVFKEMIDGGGSYGATTRVTDDSQGEIVPEIIYLGAIAPREMREEIVPQSMPNATDRTSGGTFKFYYWGRIDYQDMFDKPRYTLFSFFRTMNNARPCETGNEIH
jgi:hypothetical protein